MGLRLRCEADELALIPSVSALPPLLHLLLSIIIGIRIAMHLPL